MVVVMIIGGGADPPHAWQAPGEQDQLIGVWLLNVEKSRYVPGPRPTSETRTYARGPLGLEGTIQRRFQDGRSMRIEYVAEYDRVYPVTGTEEYDHLLLKRVDAFTAEAVLSHAGRVFGTARRVIARDGKTMTVTFRREGSQGPAVTNVAVYEKTEQVGGAPGAEGQTPGPAANRR
jgi:hypothetical protein